MTKVEKIIINSEMKAERLAYLAVEAKFFKYNKKVDAHSHRDFKSFSNTKRNKAVRLERNSRGLENVPEFVKEEFNG